MSTSKNQEFFRGRSGEKKDSDQSREVIDEVFALKEQLAEIRSFDTNLREKHASCGLTDSEAAYFTLQREVETRLDYLGDSRPVQSFTDPVSDGVLTDKESSDTSIEDQRNTDLAMLQSSGSSEVRIQLPRPELIKGGDEEAVLEIHGDFCSDQRSMRFL